MVIQIVNYEGKPLQVSPQAKTGLEAISRKAAKPNADWDGVCHEILRTLENDGFDLTCLQPEICYSEEKKGKQIISIKIYYNKP